MLNASESAICFGTRDSLSITRPTPPSSYLAAEILRYFHIAVWLRVRSSHLLRLRKPRVHSWTRAGADVFQKNKPPRQLQATPLFPCFPDGLELKCLSDAFGWDFANCKGLVRYLSRKPQQTFCVWFAHGHIRAHVAALARGQMSNKSVPNCNFTHKIRCYSAKSRS